MNYDGNPVRTTDLERLTLPVFVGFLLIGLAIMRHTPLHPFLAALPKMRTSHAPGKTHCVHHCSSVWRYECRSGYPPL